MTIENNFEARALNILLVEDNEADVKITMRAFKQAQIRNNIQVVYDGQEALAFLKESLSEENSKINFRPDIILLDINIPKIDGLELLKIVKSDISLRKIPVIMLTTSKDDKDIKDSYACGISGYILKPVQYADFEKVVQIFNNYWNRINLLPK